MPKLLDREPTQEMLKAGELESDSEEATYETVFLAMYDAAPEVNQEPLAWMLKEDGDVEYNGSDRFSCGRTGGTPLFSFPPDAQAEIAKQDERIAELEADQDKANAAVAIGNYLGKTYNYAWCNTSLASQTIDLLKEQAAEISKWKEAARTKHLEAIDWAGKQQEATEQISRLKGVIAKCKEALEDVAERLGPRYCLENNYVLHIEAIAAIKEEGL